MRSLTFAVVVLVAIGITACGQDVDDDTLAELEEELAAERERADAAEDRVAELEEQLELQAAGDDHADDDPAAETEEPGEESTEEATDLGDTPSAYTDLRSDGPTPDVAEQDGEVTVAFGPVSDSRLPFLAHNATGGPVSRIEVSGSVVADGETLTSGRSQTVHPNVVEPGGVAFGFVFAGDPLPEGATIEEPAVDYTEGLGDFENIVALDVDELDAPGGQFTGTVANPHDIEVDGPISVGVACLDDDGSLVDVVDTYADRDRIEAGGEATFTIDLFGDDLDCAGVLAGASGYDPDF